jgi:hydrogenase maturation factor
MIERAPTAGDRVLLGPGIGLDCAVLDFGSTCLVLKSEPITFASQQPGWYAVQIAANDVVTTGALPKWMLLTVLLPEKHTTHGLVDEISSQVFDACRSMDVALIGGHTEITYGLDRPILVTTLIGEVEKADLITPKGSRPGDRLLITKGVPIEATALLAREFPGRLSEALSPEEIRAAQDYIFSPGISVFRDARIAIEAGRVTAMHDPTEGGVTTALWELAEACQHTLVVNPEKIPIPPLAEKVCAVFGLDPLGAIASGALLLTVASESADPVISALHQAGIPAVEIGIIQPGPAEVIVRDGGGEHQLPRFSRDEIARIFG